MEADYMKSFHGVGVLQQELDDAKHTLVSLNDNIRRIIGRNPKDLRNDKHIASNEIKRNDSERQCQKTTETSKYKKRAFDSKSVFNRLSAPTPRSIEEESRPRLNSRVIREMPTRQEVVAAQGIDSESRARNRRMFGSLLGTLHKFCQEESRLKQKEEKKAQIEKKLEEQELQERETMKRERELLFVDRKRKQYEIKQLELKINRLKDFETWESSMLKLKNHIKTKTKPHVYFRPRIICKQTEQLLVESRNSIKNEIEKKRNDLAQELVEIENSQKLQEFDIDDHNESMDTNENCVLNESCKEIETTDESYNENVNKSFPNSDGTLAKGDLDSKENKSRNLIESSINSSVVTMQRDSNKT